jgi:hypothetical protein
MVATAVLRHWPVVPEVPLRLEMVVRLLESLFQLARVVLLLQETAVHLRPSRFLPELVVPPR